MILSGFNDFVMSKIVMKMTRVLETKYQIEPKKI